MNMSTIDSFFCGQCQKNKKKKITGSPFTNIGKTLYLKGMGVEKNMYKNIHYIKC